VSEDGARLSATDLLHVAPAKAAREHLDDVLALRFGELHELWLPVRIEDDDAHGGVS